MNKSLSEMTLNELWELFPVILSEHKTYWSDWYAQEKRRIETFLQMPDVRISHVGSTAVPGIWAKPFIDILVEIPDNRTGIVVELEYAQDGDMYIACEKALQQIEDKNYTARLKEDGMQNIIKYGIACYKKNCKVILK